MALPKFSMRELIQAGVHFGHKTKRWNPRMAPFIYGSRHDVHIIDLQKTVPMLYKALVAVRDTVANNGRVLFVGTKYQASLPISEAAKRCGQYYVDHRWLGGMLTNWNTIQQSIKTLRTLEEQLGNPNLRITKKEALQLTRQQDKLERSLGGIKDMRGLPDLLFVIDTNREDLAIAEANKLGIPVIAVVDSNSSLEGIDYPIPGNDDATRAIELYCRLISDAALEGIQQGMSHSGVDMGAQADLPEQKVPAAKKLKVVANDDAEASTEESKAEVKVETKKTATKKAAAAKTAKKAEEEKPAAKKPAAKKAPAKKAATTKKAAADKEEKPAAKKPAAKKATATKKPAAKKTTAAKK